MDFLISNAYAQTAGDATTSAIVQFAPLVILFGIFYFMLIRPQMRRAKEQRQMVAALAKGDEVITSGGMLGRIDDLSESFITLEVAPNVKLKLQRGAVTTVLPKGTLKSA
jgi:preprotein translocase subunit YajC